MRMKPGRRLLTFITHSLNDCVCKIYKSGKNSPSKARESNPKVKVAVSPLLSLFMSSTKITLLRMKYGAI